ncbi:hypothetical protein LR48_Vigan02g108900 [Vigna angularis]|uniref:Uncharacterized protein n=1 Tax=Phaseolus angularis TaxID=3914 RepID=A0A0L9TXQ7_PHAAN|nr:hypothetical protein LR48_Vigan02g108900 [Vigna angularis]
MRGKKLKASGLLAINEKEKKKVAPLVSHATNRNKEEEGSLPLCDVKEKTFFGLRETLGAAPKLGLFVRKESRRRRRKEISLSCATWIRIRKKGPCVLREKKFLTGLAGFYASVGQETEAVSHFEKVSGEEFDLRKDKCFLQDYMSQLLT